jgi:hypothetical protein
VWYKFCVWQWQRGTDEKNHVIYPYPFQHGISNLFLLYELNIGTISFPFGANLGRKHVVVKSIRVSE